MINAKRYLRRVQYYPWFSISENDTAAETMTQS
ncbi:hypothetical protein XBP1_1250002 [Xenorhabdus bovienii str. puntauvense]|uniref:Uncharacterized protein n=4 Tax=Xenorhabdus bovienii TaxID=40576 RepID=A0A0B6X861_XENBV|nr:hypothetical protein XBFFR1_2190005 [Xenorhabdus bovienii str. feltiae France]CDG92818.1 hypothetical protein XBFFL1_2320025 [Xenorhabdus bovienii str. feltiae Florida]CDG95372.1 hypothetical protein XBP1_1250002 [Xenorhabdus bovienii str. puntauvense]CDH01022.1 hypothetical protein XBFM1_1940032 [Xenorhabdus bovienii str. feltiae Moldova]CDH24532.1 hypothetical protein XBKB1_2960027 [Xenorhabdus bovienii str. kraussei Becker Underwood]CDM89321.1 protein of unknown function [Xenorhabdus bov